MAEVVQCRNQRPTVHLRLVDLLGAVVQARRIPKTNGVGRGKQTEIRVRRDDFVLVQQGQLAVRLKHTLDHEHNVRAARVVFVEHDSGRIAQGPWQDAFVEFGDLLAIAQFDRVLTDQVDPRNVAIKVHTNGGPVQARRDLFDVGRFTCAVIALNHHTAVMAKAGQDRQGRVWVEFIGRVDFRHTAGTFRKPFDLHVAVDTENVTDAEFFGWFCILVQHIVSSTSHFSAQAKCNIRRSVARGRGTIDFSARNSKIGGD